MTVVSDIVCEMIEQATTFLVKLHGWRMFRILSTEICQPSKKPLNGISKSEFIAMS